MTLREMASLQGIDLGNLNKEVVSKSEMGQLIGNAMTVPVIGAVIEQALQAMGLHSAGRARSNLGTRGEGQSEAIQTAPKPATKPKSRSKATSSAKATEVAQPLVDIDGQRAMMVDSGASIHIVNEGELSAEEIQRTRPLHESMLIVTANGEVTATHCTDIHIRSLDLWVEAMILGKSPTVLSMGRLVEDHGVRIEWISKVPTLHHNGLRVDCYVRSKVPFLLHARAAPASTPPSSPQEAPTPLAVEDSQGTAVPPTVIDPPTPEDVPLDAGGVVGEQPDADQEAPEQPGADQEAGQPDANQEAPRRKRKRVKPIKRSDATHNPFTHFPFDKNCDVCRIAKHRRSQHRRSPKEEVDDLPPPEKFGDAITADHQIVN